MFFGSLIGSPISEYPALFTDSPPVPPSERHQTRSSLETQGQSVGSGEKAGRKFSSTGERAPGYRRSPNCFQKFKQMLLPIALYHCEQSANSSHRVLFVSSYTTAIVSPHLPGSFTKLVCARETFIFYFPDQKRRNYRRVEKTFGMLSAGAIEFAPRIVCF